MIDSLDAWAKLLVGGFVLLGFTAVAVAFYKAKVTEAQLTALRGDRDDLKTRVERLEGDKVRLETENSALLARVSVLESLVSPNEAIAKLVDALAAHDDNVGTRYAKQDRNINQILKHLDKIVASMELN
jgi:hypothetical protein